ncbi:acetylxylan esterase [Lacihabitans sp. LS3-19]|uniref:acetylxylan esterase n=1 Tax=Lacihabitans sp. LS3-19 TaxID=2487335 RepID=UPI0020CDFEA0|nr:acetylxylan esterase [Lacihabitans sp. LS3-19]MCP9768361.1 acetylxylan esterase [Lacihabitans sp. LS3-19]
MHQNLKPSFGLIITFVLMISCAQTSKAQGPPRRVLPPIPIKGDTSHNLSRHFIPSSSAKISPGSKGFIQRWNVLEPVKKEIARNNIFTDNYLRTNILADNFSTDFMSIPKKDEKVKIGEQNLKWYALDSKTFNFNLFNFSYDINQPKYGLLFWLVTVIDSPQELQNVRMTAGCNSGGMFWLNGEEVLMLSGDRDMIVDNVSSQRITLKKGRNIIRGAVINGPGMINFCMRFIDEKGNPVTNFSISKD